MTTKDPQLICEDTIDPKTKKHLLVCSLNVRRQAGKHVSDPIKLLMQGNYLKHRGRLHKALDIVGIGFLILTITAVAYLVFPKNTPDLIVIDASVAPEQVITGDLSTLTFRYENNSDETIKNTRLMFELPEHFELANIDTDVEEVSTLTFDIGDIAPTQYGYIHVQGTMFGNVGGDQIFTTTLNYIYSEDEIEDTKVKEHIFQPIRSALALELSLPEHLVAYQLVEGTISYTNTGSVTFPELIIEPDWPESFSLISSAPALQSNAKFYVDGIEPGETGVIEFTGQLGSADDSTFDFYPSFIFDTAQYNQSKLTDVIGILPTPLQLSHAVKESSIIPGESTTIELQYENVSDYELSNIELRISDDINIFGTSGIEGGSYNDGYYYFDNQIENLNAGANGSITMILPNNSSLSRSATDIYESINITTTASAQFSFTPNDELITVNTFGSSFDSPLTSPITLSSFGRYWGPNGDQLGRGPIPPAVDEVTKYWIFWNISGTTNDLENLSINADLGTNVELTGRQSVSTGSSIDSENGTVTWTINSLNPTLPPTSTVVGIAFEVAITPSEDQLETTPILLGQTSVNATDAWTQSFISSWASGVTTSIPYDTKASSYGGIVTY
ncbi:hypothetical protein HN358_02575 [Candidatus Uhrbacteria bacterium]|jgi:hypothetical protein|nr:hypothetical protein [Candidatus Uhrbacteria bacterium]MBT7717564.1 hypothetical protein [Candidatus Uhrbacteria bacterium]